MYHIVKKKIVLNESSDRKKESMGYNGYIRSKVSLIVHHLLNLVNGFSKNQLHFHRYQEQKLMY